jgi:hypothetical protein
MMLTGASNAASVGQVARVGKVGSKMNIEDVEI